jgi:hypothetical protein
MRDLGLIMIIAGLVITAGVAIHYATRTRPAPRHAPSPAGEEDTFIAELRGQPADRFSPGVVVPFTPQLGEPLKPLPAPVILDADAAFDDVKAIVSEAGPEPHHEPLLARYERLIDSRPAPVQELLHYHADTDAAVDSILQRTLTPDLLAALDKAKLRAALDKAKEEAVSDA